VTSLLSLRKISVVLQHRLTTSGVFSDVNPQTRPRKEWVLTQESFDRFLAILDHDREKAGEKYEEIRLKLLKYFQWCGSTFPDIDSDETLNRVMRRMEEGANVYNLNGYIYGVARLVQTESLKRRHLKQHFEDASLVALSSLGVDAEAAQRTECLERCLGCLGAKDRSLIIEYYKHEKAERVTGRERLAARLGISLNSLRLKMHRRRVRLEGCMKKCLGRYE
jgi:DNA-directed RNA polymerase specialized sigma24 family protein